MPESGANQDDKSGIRKREQASWWTGEIVRGRTVRVRVDEDLCMATQSCVVIAPNEFRFDPVKQKSDFTAPPRKVGDAKDAENDNIFLAAQSCPYQAIIVEDADTGERLYP